MRYWKLLYEVLKIGLQNASIGLRPRTALLTPRSQFFTIRTDLKPAKFTYLFFPHSLKSIFSFFHFHTHKHVALCKCSKRTNVVRRNFFILILQYKNLFEKKALAFQLSCPIKSCFEKKLFHFNGFANKRTKTRLSVTVTVSRIGIIRIA